MIPVKIKRNNLILGGGISGLTAGLTTGWPVFEAEDKPGGICSSYTINGYRFEVGGGHWIFGAGDEVLKFIAKFAHLKEHIRNSAVYFNREDLSVPYPIQNNVSFLDKNIAARALREISRASGNNPSTMKEWLKEQFGPTLCKIFFYPFHDLYTAKLYEKIAPQDAYKSPVSAQSIGYNAIFVYPKEGLDGLVRHMAEECVIHYRKRATKIDVKEKVVHFTDGSALYYNRLISTLPLNKMMEMTDLRVNAKTDPHTSALVLNIGVVRGKNFPDEHWLYNADNRSGFHRIGFYSNVDKSFLPKLLQKTGRYVGMYVEKTYKGGEKPSEEDIKKYAGSVVNELRQWGLIKDVNVLDHNWIDVAYTWSWPGSLWKEKALSALNKHSICQLGRYGRWKFQGIAESIGEGLLSG